MIDATKSKSAQSRIFVNPPIDDVFFSFGRCVSILGLFFFLVDISFFDLSAKVGKKQMIVARFTERLCRRRVTCNPVGFYARYNT